MIRLLVAVLILLPSITWAAGFDHTHAKWDKVLKTYVTVKPDGSASQVNYAELASKRTDLDAYVTEIESVTKADYDKWTDTQKQAFLINAYNALVIKLVLDNKTPKSIKDIGGILWSPWNKKFFKLFGTETSLDGIAHGLIRNQFNNCRFNFALSMAATGSPMLRNEAYVADKLPAQLEDAAKRFVTDNSRNSFEAKSNSLQVSPLFNWAAKDFEKDPSCGGATKAFITRFITNNGKPVPTTAHLKFVEFDWSLNGK